MMKEVVIAGAGRGSSKYSPTTTGRLRTRTWQDASQTDGSKGLNVLVPIFLTALFVPWVLTIGEMVISPYRFLLILTLVPCLWLWASGKAGPVRIPDFAVLGYALWCAISLGANHGADVGFKSGGVLGVETVGSYFLGRILIRNADDFRRMCTVLFTAVMILLPFALIETITGQNYLLRGFSAFMPSIGEYRMPGRLGLERVQSVFDHPILFGVCTGGALALSFSVMGYGAPGWRRWGTACLVVLTAFTSLSAGPMSAIAAQVLLLLWGWLLRSYKARWTLLLWLVGLALLLIDLFARRPLPNVLLTSFSLDAESAYYRVLIWNFGSQSALNHPVFGVGFGMWDHPSWMTQSIDMFWLYPAIVFGLPASVLMFTAFLGSAISVGRKRYLSPRDYSFRMGYLICLAGFFVVGWTVHFWNATYVLFMFLLASGLWLLDVPEHKSQEESGPAASRTTRPSALAVRHMPTRERPKVSARRPAHGG